MNSKVSSGSETLLLRWDSGKSYGRVGNLTEWGICAGSVQFCHMEEPFTLAQSILSTLGTMMPRNPHKEVQAAISSVLWGNAISETSTGWQGCYFLMLLDTYSLSLCFSPNRFHIVQGSLSVTSTNIGEQNFICDNISNEFPIAQLRDLIRSLRTLNRRKKTLGRTLGFLKHYKPITGSGQG